MIISVGADRKTSLAERNPRTRTAPVDTGHRHAEPLTGAVFVCSTGDSEHLRRCLSSLSHQAVSEGLVLDSVTVVWNGSVEANEASQESITQWTLSNWSAAFPLQHAFENQRGIPFARNRALFLAARQGLDWFAFIDDDCVAHSDWLEQLTSRAQDSDADVVAGSWEIVADGEASTWLPRGIFGPKGYELDGHLAQDGDRLPTAYTRNVLVKTSAVTSAPEEARSFGETLSERGGSDVIFFHGLSQAGARIVYAKDAVVDEVYGGKRLTFAWQFKRRIRNTQLRLSRAHRTRERTASSKGSLTTLLHLSWRLPASLLLSPLSIFSPRCRRFIGTTVLWSAPYVAAVLHAIGIHYLEYADKFVLDFDLPKRTMTKS